MSFSDADLKRLKKAMAPFDLCRFQVSGEKTPESFDTKLLVGRLEAAEKLEEYCVHDRDCIRSLRSAGEPTENGGYRELFNGVWYQSKPVDETPKCDCGLDEMYDAWCKAAGK